MNGYWGYPNYGYGMGYSPYGGLAGMGYSPYSGLGGYGMPGRLGGYARGLTDLLAGMYQPTQYQKNVWEGRGQGYQNLLDAYRQAIEGVTARIPGQIDTTRPEAITGGGTLTQPPALPSPTTDQMGGSLTPDIGPIGVSPKPYQRQWGRY